MNILKTAEKKISTFLLMNNGVSKAEMILHKNVLQSDEKAFLKCHFDNTQCEKDIQNVKVKLKRVITAKSNSGETFQSAHDLCFFNVKGVPAG